MHFSQKIYTICDYLYHDRAILYDIALGCS